MFNRRTGLVRGGDWIDPFAVFTRLAPEFTDVLGESTWPGFRARADTATWAPQVDVFERDNRLIARVDLPGTKKEEVKVDIVDGWLTIFGERRHEEAEEKDDFYRRERSYGAFRRALPLPDTAKIEEVKAVFDNGVLEITVPLTAGMQAAPRSVAIETPAKTGMTTKAA